MSSETRTETGTLPEISYQWTPVTTNIEMPSGGAESPPRHSSPDPALEDLRRLDGTDRDVLYHLPRHSSVGISIIIDGGWYMPDAAGELCSGMMLVAGDETDATA